MKRNVYKNCWFLLFVVLLSGVVKSEVNHIKLNSIGEKRWGCDSAIVGAQLLVKDSTDDVVVALKYARNRLSGELCFMHPSYPDSALFLFHNLPERFEGESTSVNLGKFPEGTSLVFRYMIVDTAAPEPFQFTKLYSGENREGVDTYISERGLGPQNFGKRWAAACQSAEDTVTVGFNDAEPLGFLSVVFTVSCATIEKNKIPSFYILPEDTVYKDETRISFDINPEALKRILVYFRDTVTIDVQKKEGISLHYYYTTDGTDPVTSETRIDYTEPFTISKTTTVKAYAAIEGDSTWYPSDVVTRTFTKEGSTGRYAHRMSSSRLYASTAVKSMESYDLFGRRIATTQKRYKGLTLQKVNGSVVRRMVIE